ncbi:MAG: hypothetical protein PHQ33_04980 [Bacteroidales bacterium]|nr:hypothetical protein [Bacteroidales bacterium]
MSNTQYAVCHLQRGSGNDSAILTILLKLMRKNNMPSWNPAWCAMNSILP